MAPLLERAFGSTLATMHVPGIAPADEHERAKLTEIASTPIDVPAAAEDRFIAKVGLGPAPPAGSGLDGDCMLWEASCNRSGYGQFKLGGKTMLAHRVSFLLYRGPIPAGMHVHHRCERPLCCNPDHLELIPEPRHVAAHNRQRRQRLPKALHRRIEIIEGRRYVATYRADNLRILVPVAATPGGS